MTSKNYSRNIAILRSQPKPGKVFDTYWRFAAERQNILMLRLSGAAGPWTNDPILSAHKFTNVYRVTDRVSQYLVKRVIGTDERSHAATALRILLFKIFNKIETWELMEEQRGEISDHSFDPGALRHLLDLALGAGAAIYSAAYIMPSGPVEIRQPKKHWMHLELLRTLLENGLPDLLAASPTMAQGYALLRGLPGFGPFLAYQYATDLAYSRHFGWNEMEFVVPGPGALDGIRKCFVSLGEYTEADTIRWVAERQEAEFNRLGLQFQRLGSRPLQLIDCQNVFCEVDKYARVAHPDVVGRSARIRIKQKFIPTAPIDPLVMPIKWHKPDQ